MNNQYEMFTECEFKNTAMINKDVDIDIKNDTCM